MSSTQDIPHNNNKTLMETPISQYPSFLDSLEEAISKYPALLEAKKRLNQTFSEQKENKQPNENIIMKTKDPMADVFRSLFPDMKKTLENCIDLIRGINLNDTPGTMDRLARANRNLTTLNTSIDIASRFLPYLTSEKKQ